MVASETGDMTVFIADFAALADKGALNGAAVAVRAAAVVSSQSSQQSSSQSVVASGWAASRQRVTII